MGINTSFLPAVLESWGYAHVIATKKAEEDAAFVGCNRSLACLHQIGQLEGLHEQYSDLLKACERTHNVVITTLLVMVIPVAIAVADFILEEFGEDTALTKPIHWLHGNLGSLCQIASIITSLALLQLGHVAYAVTSLTIVSLGYLERRNYLPLPVRRVYNHVSPWIGYTGTLLYGSWLLKLVALPELLGKVHRLLFHKEQIPYEKATHPSHLTSLQQFYDIFNRKVEVEVNQDHVWIAPFPIVSRPNFYSLTTFCNNFAWPIDSLRKSLLDDPRWNRADKKSDVEYAKKNFNTFVHNIVNECIETGEVLDYRILKNYLGYIAEKLPLASKELQDEIMIQLSVEGGDYCGSGVYYQLEAAATALLLNQQSSNGEKQRLPLKQRSLLILQQERLRIMESFHLLINRINSGISFWKGGQKDIHSMNFTIQLLGGNHFGLPDQGANQDKTAKATVLEQWFARWITGVYPNHLWTSVDYKYETIQQRIAGVRHSNKHVEGYTVQRILDTYKSHAGSPSIPNSDIYEWAQKWIEKAPQEDRNEFLDKLQDGRSFEQNLQFKDGFLMAMLVDMGILQIKKNPEASRLQ